MLTPTLDELIQAVKRLSTEEQLVLMDYLQDMLEVSAPWMQAEADADFQDRNSW